MSKIKMDEKSFQKVENETSYLKYCCIKMEKEEGNQPSILDYIQYLEFRHDNEQETLYRAKERYISLMKTLKENRELKKENEKLISQMTSMCSEQADSDAAKYIEGLEEIITSLKKENEELEKAQED
tara:strand:+ start:23 stop:403 length:381 start_codon:yes stop_codon:yes gene_type:complete